MRLIDEQYTRCPFYGSRRITKWLVGQGHEVNRKRVQRLLRVMGLEAIYPKPNLSAGRGHKVYPYLLRDVAVERVNQVWSADITYVPLPGGFMYLAATIDWFSRYVVAWRLSNTLDGSFCQDMLEEALGRGTPEVFNTDQGVQFTAGAWTGRLESAGVSVSMDGRGRCLDNVFVERLWRSVKYEDVYLLLQRRAVAPVAGLPDPGRGVRRRGQDGLTKQERRIATFWSRQWGPLHTTSQTVTAFRVFSVIERCSSMSNTAPFEDNSRRSMYRTPAFDVESARAAGCCCVKFGCLAVAGI